jgi:hypothetical protein
MSCDRFKYFLKIASYNVPQDDMYAAGSMQRHMNNKYEKAMSAKNMATAAGAAAGATAAYKLSKPFADKRIPFSQQKLRGAAMLGAGLYVGKKIRDRYNKASTSSAGAV